LARLYDSSILSSRVAKESRAMSLKRADAAICKVEGREDFMAWS